MTIIFIMTITTITITTVVSSVQLTITTVIELNGDDFYDEYLYRHDPGGYDGLVNEFHNRQQPAIEGESF